MLMSSLIPSNLFSKQKVLHYDQESLRQLIKESAQESLIISFLHLTTSHSFSYLQIDLQA